MMPTAPEPASVESLETLDRRIAEAEARLIAREAAVQQQWRGLVRQTRRAVEPQRLLLPLLGGFGGLALLRRLFGRAPIPTPPHKAPPSAAASPGGAIEAVLMSLIPALYPLLPLRWRSKVSPALLTTSLSLGLPMLRQLLARRRADEATPPPTAGFVDLARYAGRWYEIARLPNGFEARCEDQPTASYELRGEEVVVVNRCGDAQGKTQVSEGLARVVPDSGGAKLKVSFAPSWLRWLPLAWADYWILDRDEDYTLALVGTPSRQSLWLLARSPQIAPEALQALVDRARAIGYDVDRLQMSTGS